MKAWRVGIYTRDDHTRGLWRDAEALAWALEGHPVPLPGETLMRPDIFAVKQYGDEHAVDGRRFDKMLAEWDALIWVENLTHMMGLATLARSRGVRTIFIPNLDWACIGGRRDASGFVHLLNELRIPEGPPAIDQVWAKTPRTFERLLQAGVHATRLRLVPWSIPDTVVLGRDVSFDPARPLRFYMNAGYHGWQDRRGVDIVLRAFAKVRSQVPTAQLWIHSLRPGEDGTVDGVRWLRGERPRAALREDLLMTDVALIPSRWEGLGLSLLEALHAGSPVITTNGWPMNELLTDEVHGFVVDAQKMGRLRLANHYEPDVNRLADAMLRFTDRGLLASMTCAEPGYYTARQHAFAYRVRAYARGEDTPEVLVVRSPGKPADVERSERYWESALSDFGLDVKSVPFSTPAAVMAALESKPAFVLVGKTPAKLVAQIRSKTKAPVAVYHHDLMHAAPTWMRWFEDVMQYADFGFIPEDPHNYRGMSFMRRLVRLLPGPRVAPPGTQLGRRFKMRGLLKRRPVVLHQTTYASDQRTRVLRILGDAEVPLVIQGSPAARFPTVRGTFEEGRWGWDGRLEAVRADVLLSVSLRNDVRGYTSNRLVNAGAIGACVLAVEYPGCREDFTDTSVWWTKPHWVARDAQRLLADENEQTRLRESVVQETWRNHTWHRRFELMLRVLGRRDARAHRSDPDLALTVDLKGGRHGGT